MTKHKAINMSSPQAQEEAVRLEVLRGLLAELYAQEPTDKVLREREKLGREIAQIIEERYQ